MKAQLFATIVVSSALAFIGCRAPAADKIPPQTIRVMTYNIHHAEGVDGKIDTARIAELIRREKVDIVGLQEIDRGIERSGGRDLIAELAQLTGMQFSFGKNIVYKGGDYGNAVLTRFPILKSSNTHFKMLHPHEQRGIQELVLDVNGKELVFMNTHIDYRPEDEERRANVIEMRRMIKSRSKQPIVLTGDFNTTPDTEVYAQMSRFMTDTWAVAGHGDGLTLYSNGPEKRIDYVWFAPNQKIAVEKVWVPSSQASDHLPVVAQFTLK